MNAFCLIAVSAIILSTPLRAEDEKSVPKKEPPKIISALEATNHVDESVIVTGKVAQVTIRERMVYLNMEKPYPGTPLSGVIFAAKTNLFTDLEKLKDKNVELSGKITLFRDRAQIVVESTNQLNIVEKKKDSAEPEKK